MGALPRPLRFIIVVAVLAVPTVVALALLKRKNISLGKGGLLGAVMLVEDLPFAQATRRSEVLSRHAGSLRRTIQKRYLIGMATVSAAFGGFIGRATRADGLDTLLAITPVLAVVFLLLGTTNAVIGS